MTQLQEYKMFTVLLTTMFNPEEFLERINKLPEEHRAKAKLLITKVLFNAIVQSREATNN